MKKRRIIGLLLSFCLLLTMAPAALAAECDDSPDGRHDWYSEYEGYWSDACTWEGWNWEECWYCGATRNWSYDVEYYHVWGSWHTVQEATCQSEGRRERTCEDCGKKESQTISKSAHKWGSEKIVTQATDHSAGTKTRTCSVCGTQDTVSYDPEGTLRRGDTGDAVKDLQQLLVDQGFLSGAVDGNFGSGTEAAVKAFQSSAGLTADGVAWPQTINRLNHQFGAWTVVTDCTPFSAGLRTRVCADCGYVDEDSFLPDGTLIRGDKGSAVTALQEALNRAGYDCGTADGSFGAKTETAIKNYQKSHGLTQDGIGWPGVMAMLGVPGYDNALTTPAPTPRTTTALNAASCVGTWSCSAVIIGGVTYSMSDLIKLSALTGTDLQIDNFLLILYADGSYKLSVGEPEDVITGSWQVENGRLILTYAGIAFMEMTYEDEQLLYEDESGTMVFSRHAEEEATEEEATEEEATEEEATEEAEPPAAAIPESEPAPKPTAEPTPVPTPEPTPEPTAEPTAVPTPEPTAVPTPEPTTEPAPEPEAPTLTSELKPRQSAQTSGACGRRRTAGGDGYLAYTDAFCPTHASTAQAADGLPYGEQLALWTAAVQSEYEMLAEEMTSDADILALREEVANYDAWLDSFERYLNATLPDTASIDGLTKPEMIDAVLTRIQQVHARALCGMRLGTPLIPGDGPVSLDNTSDGCCRLNLTADGDAVTSEYFLCAEHKLAARATLTVGGRQALGLWKLALNNFVDDELERAGDGAASAIGEEHSAFSAWADSWSSLTEIACPDDADAQLDLRIRVYEDLVVIRCYLNDKV